jgi:hypothetical protein
LQTRGWSVVRCRLVDAGCVGCDWFTLHRRGTDASDQALGAESMSPDDEINRQVGELFSKLHSDLLIDDIEALDAVLPDDLAVLTGLSARCVEESRKALRAGQHMEGSASTFSSDNFKCARES